MAYSIEYTPDGRGVYRMGEGVVTGAELVAAAQSEIGDPARARGLRWGLIDLTRVTRLALTAAELRAISEANLRLAALTPDIAIGVVTGGNGVFDTIQMWQAMAKATGWKIEVFRSRADAEAWIRSERGATPP